MKLISSKEKADEIITKIQTPAPKRMTPEAAVGFILNNNLSKTSYNRTRALAISLDHDLYPSYDEVSVLP